MCIRNEPLKTPFFYPRALHQTSFENTEFHSNFQESRGTALVLPQGRWSLLEVGALALNFLQSCCRAKMS